MSTAPAFEVRIRADKSGENTGPPWPVLGVELPAVLPEQVDLPVSFVRRHRGSDWLEPVGIGWVERPSRPDPAVDDNGRLIVAPEHREPDPELPAPHSFMQAEGFVFHTLNHGRVEYRVVVQPDKYLQTGVEELAHSVVDLFDLEAPVTPEAYAEGQTVVINYYGLELVSAETPEG